MNPMLQQFLTTLVRAGLIWLSGHLIPKGVFQSGEMDQYIGAATIGLLALGWALWSRYKSRITFLAALQAPPGTTEKEVKEMVKSGEKPPLPMILLPFLIGSLLIAAPGCAFLRNSTPQKIAVTSIGTVQTATIAAYDGYMDAVIKGAVKTNGVPKVAVAFNHFQAATLVALDGVQFSTNALAPASLVIISQDVLNLIANWSK